MRRIQQERHRIRRDIMVNVDNDLLKCDEILDGNELNFNGNYDGKELNGEGKEEITESSNERIDWDMEIAQQIQRQMEYNGDSDNVDSLNGNNNQANYENGTSVEYEAVQNAKVDGSSEVNNENESANNVVNSDNENNGQERRSMSLFQRIFGSDPFGLNSMLQYPGANINSNGAQNSSSNAPNQRSNGSYTVRFRGSNNVCILLLPQGSNRFSLTVSSNNNMYTTNSLNQESRRNRFNVNNDMNNPIFRVTPESLLGSMFPGSSAEVPLIQIVNINSRSNGLNDNEIDNHSIIDKYKSKDDNTKNEDCLICMEKLKNNDEIRRLPCMHIFHKNEIDIWLKTKDSCPICRQSITQQ